jgi:ADP-ribose pyrophosphatase YjhB (NUDIX family)
MTEKAWGISAYALLQSGKGKCLFLRRSPDAKTTSRRWEPLVASSIPGERLDAALQRKVFEEAGLRTSVRRLLGATARY